MTDAGARWVRRPARVAALLAALLVAVACTTTQGPAGRPAPTPTSTTAPELPATTAEPRRPVRIAFAGDIHFEGVLADRLRDPRTALATATRALAGADLAVANLETSVGTGGRPDPTKRFTFSAGPEALTALAAAGIDVATMANNHALDFGRERLPSTFRAIGAAAGTQRPLTVIGIGRDAEAAFRPSLTDVDGTVVATISASLADQDPTADPTGSWAATDDRAGIADALDPTRLLAGVRRADRDADVAVAYLHWGVQGERCPSPDQRSLARRLVRAGADVVVGTHAHRLQGDGRLGQGYVAYGLGNFAWYSPGPTGVLTLTVRPPDERPGRARVTRARWWPAAIGADGLAARSTGEAAERFAAEREALRACAGLRR
ncbi:CapA family protein [Nocardioides hwasunensis]|uniref:CapA family protein n=1 Tax=Nocardioides hwasunensis TaxID=397258 RepID=A0ABR8MEP7_9ACTN|nr:CapA family protein [Nocardioides hwasunensis]MBD3914576.1 CapA family protein [Nocardioides hwasunensis]